MQTELDNLLMTVDPQGIVRGLSRTGAELLEQRVGDYFPVFFRHQTRTHETRLQSIRIPLRGATSHPHSDTQNHKSQKFMECWLAPLSNQDGVHTGFALIRCPDQKDILLSRTSSTSATFSRPEIERALKSGEFRLVYQPEQRMRDQQTRVAEALLRWQRPNGVTLTAQDFMADAERHGLAQDIGSWVIEQVCQQNRRWQMHGLRPLSVSVNLSPQQLSDNRIVQQIQQQLDASGLPAHYLQLEVNARCLHGDGQADLGILHQLKGLGLRLMLDDLSVQRNSLQQLLLWPVDAVKINVRQWNETLASIARGMGKVLIARGMENSQMLESSLQADAMQGHAVCQPLDAQAMAHRLDRGHWAA